MKLELQYSYYLSSEDVVNAVRHWFNSVHNIRIPRDAAITPTFIQKAIPGMILMIVTMLMYLVV